MVNLFLLRHRILQKLDFVSVYVALLFLKIRCGFPFPRRRLVVIALIEHLGDIVACEPVARQVRQQEHDACVIWCVKSDYRELVLSNPVIDGVLSVYCLTTWIRLRKSMLIDRLVDLHIRGRVCPQCGVPLPKEEGDSSITLDNYYSYGALLPTFCRAAGLFELHDQPQLALTGNRAWTRETVGSCHGFLVVHACSHEASRDWHWERWNELIDRLNQELRLAVVEVGYASWLGRRSSSQYTDLCGKLSILKTAEMIREAILFVGIDSGPAHMANAVGTYGVVLLGKYRAFDRYLPYTGGYADGTNATLVYAEGAVAGLAVDVVYGAIVAALGRGDRKT